MCFLLLAVCGGSLLKKSKPSKNVSIETYFVWYNRSLLYHVVCTILPKHFYFSFNAGDYKQKIEVVSVQTEVDAGYEGKENVILVEAKNSTTTNTIIRQLYYPYRQWSEHTKKEVTTLFFEKRENIYSIWHFGFKDKNDYNSIYLKNAKRFEIKHL